MTPAVFAERLAVLQELRTIERDLAAFEQRHGWDPEAVDLRRRLDAVRALVLEQLTGGNGRVH